MLHKILSGQCDRDYRPFLLKRKTYVVTVTQSSYKFHSCSDYHFSPTITLWVFTPVLDSDAVSNSDHNDSHLLYSGVFHTLIRSVSIDLMTKTKVIKHSVSDHHVRLGRSMSVFI